MPVMCDSVVCILVPLCVRMFVCLCVSATLRTQKLWSPDIVKNNLALLIHGHTLSIALDRGSMPMFRRHSSEKVLPSGISSFGSRSQSRSGSIRSGTTELQTCLAGLMRQSKAVICCRVSPRQVCAVLATPTHVLACWLELLKR
jgi:hypothetical protein